MTADEPVATRTASSSNVGGQAPRVSVRVVHLLVTYLRGELPLSAEAIRKFGPMHIPIATKGYENLFVALANRRRVDGSTLCSSEGCIRCAPKMEYLICILA